MGTKVKISNRHLHINFPEYITQVYIKTNYTDIPEVFERVNITYRGNAKTHVPFSEIELLNLAGGIPDENFKYFHFSV